MRKLIKQSRLRAIHRKHLLAMLIAGSIAPMMATSTFAQDAPQESKAVATSTATVTVGVAGTATTDSPEKTVTVTATEIPQEAQKGEVKVVVGQPIELKAVAVANDDSATAALGKYWLGLGLKKVEGDLATYLGSEEGMLIFQVYPDSPASKAEWKVGDILLSLNGQPISEFETLLKEVNSLEAKSAKCVLLRKGEKVEEKITPELRPKDMPQISPNAAGDMSFRFEAAPAIQTPDGKKVMIFKALPFSKDGELPAGDIKVFSVEGGELKVAAGATEAVPELNQAIKSLKNIDVTQIGQAMTITVDASGDKKEGDTTLPGKNISVSIVGKSDSQPGKYTVTIDGETFEGTMDKLEEAPEKVRAAIKKFGPLNGGKNLPLPDGARLMISPKIIGKDIQVMIDKDTAGNKTETSKSSSSTITTTIIGDNNDGDIKKQIAIAVQKAAEAAKKASGEKLNNSETNSSITTSTRIVIASQDENGEMKVIEVDPNSVINEKKIAELVEQAQKKAEAARAQAKDKVGIAIGSLKIAGEKLTEGDKKQPTKENTFQLKLQAANSDETAALKKEIAELRDMIEELKKQIATEKK